MEIDRAGSHVGPAVVIADVSLVLLDACVRHDDLGSEPLREGRELVGVTTVAVDDQETAGLPPIQLVRSLTGSAASSSSGYRSHEKGGQW